MTNGQNDHCLYPSQKLAAKIAAKTLHADPAQAAIAIRLDQLIDRLQTAALSHRQLPMVIRQILNKIHRLAELNFMNGQQTLGRFYSLIQLTLRLFVQRNLD